MKFFCVPKTIISGIINHETLHQEKTASLDKGSRTQMGNWKIGEQTRTDKQIGNSTITACNPNCSSPNWTPLRNRHTASAIPGLPHRGKQPGAAATNPFTSIIEVIKTIYFSLNYKSVRIFLDVYCKVDEASRPRCIETRSSLHSI